MEKVLLPKLAAKGITDPDKVKDMIATIFTNRTASNLFTTMYMQRDQIYKNERLNAGADGIDEGVTKGQLLTQGHEAEALAKLRTLKRPRSARRFRPPITQRCRSATDLTIRLKANSCARHSAPSRRS